MTNQDQSFCLNLVRTVDDDVREVLHKATDVKLYKFNIEQGKWIPTPVEGMLVFYRRSANPPFGLLLLARDSRTHSWTHKFGTEVEIQLRSPFLLYKSYDVNQGNCIDGLWFPHRERCEDMYKKVLNTTSPPAHPSYASMVAGGMAELNGKTVAGQKRNLLDDLEEQEMLDRSRAAEQVVKALQVPGKFPPCQHCGRNNHAASRCFKIQGKQEGKNGPAGKGISPKKSNEIAQTLTFENKQILTQRNAHQQIATASTCEFVDSAILESSSSSSGNTQTAHHSAMAHQNRKNKSHLTAGPVNLSALLTASVPSGGSVPLHHAASFPNMATDLKTVKNPQMALRVASDQLKEFLRLPSISDQPVHSASEEEDGQYYRPQAGLVKMTDIGSSAEKLLGPPEGSQRFHRDVTEKLKEVAGVPPALYGSSTSGEDEASFSQMPLRPPHHFETLIAGTCHVDSVSDQPHLLLPEHMEGAQFSRHTVAPSGRVNAGTIASLNPLTKEQLLQSMDWLMRNDRDFVTKLHEGYIRSLMDNLKL